MEHPHRIADALDATADLCDAVRPEDWTPEDRADVLASAKTLAARLPALTARVRGARALLGGGMRACDSPPDLDGFCIACGKRLAGPVAGHDRGCLFLPVTILNRIAVRVARYTASVGRDVRGIL